MKSTIKLDIDADNKPCIIIKNYSSLDNEDLREKVLFKFLYELSGCLSGATPSNWLKIKDLGLGGVDKDGGYNTYKITPISNSNYDLKNTIKQIEEVIYECSSNEDSCDPCKPTLYKYPYSNEEFYIVKLIKDNDNGIYNSSYVEVIETHGNNLDNKIGNKFWINKNNLINLESESENVYNSSSYSSSEISIQTLRFVEGVFQTYLNIFNQNHINMVVGGDKLWFEEPKKLKTKTVNINSPVNTTYESQHLDRSHLETLSQHELSKLIISELEKFMNI